MKKLIGFAIATIMIVALATACNQPAAPTTAAAQPVSKDSLINRGKYLVGIMGCGDCHSPKKMGPMGTEEDTSLLLSGHPASVSLAPIDTAAVKNWVLFNGMTTAYIGPWGASFSANITSDSTGIGNWTEEQFDKALRHGKSKGLERNRMLLPPMPWTTFSKLSDADFSAVFAYLKSTRPIKNVVPTAIPPNMLNKKG